MADRLDLGRAKRPQSKTGTLTVDLSFTASLLVSVAILALLAAFVSGGRGELVAPHADTCCNVPVVGAAQPRFLGLGVCFVAPPAACCVTFPPPPEASGADAVPPAKRLQLAKSGHSPPPARGSMSEMAMLRQLAFPAPLSKLLE